MANTRELKEALIRELLDRDNVSIRSVEISRRPFTTIIKIEVENPLTNPHQLEIDFRTHKL